MARTPAIEKPAGLRLLGIGFLALLALFVLMVFAVFNKTFVSSVPVTMTASNAGLNLPKHADVKLRGMIVGEVREVKTVGDGAVMSIALKPEFVDDIPADVTGQIVPKTLFGEKYVSLIPPTQQSDRSIQAGDVITNAEVPIEVENVLNDLHPLLESINPEELSYTLTAMADALDGRGAELGETIATASDYLEQLTPEVPTLVRDLDQLGDVADGYTAAMPELGELLGNAVVTADTVVAKQSQLEAFFVEGSRLARTLTDFTKASGDDLISLNRRTRPVLQVIDRHSVTFPCFLEAMALIEPRLASVMRDGKVHINLELLPLAGQPTGYRPDEVAAVSKHDLDTSPHAQPSCLELESVLAGNNPYPQDNPYSVPAEVYQLIGVKESHNKFGAESEFERVAPGASSLSEFVRPSARGIDSPDQREALRTIIGAMVGHEAADVPDIATLLISPVVRGSEVAAHEARP